MYEQHNLIEALDIDIARLQSVRDALAAIPAVGTSTLHSSGQYLFDNALIQLWPSDDATDRKTTALAFAKSLGGDWHRRGDGSYEGTGFESPTLRHLKFILHRIEVNDEKQSLTAQIKAFKG